MPAKKKLSFEQAMQRLSEIVEELESGENSLETAMKLFEEGAALSAQCYTQLDTAEQKITELNEMGDE